MLRTARFGPRGRDTFRRRAAPIVAIVAALAMVMLPGRAATATAATPAGCPTLPVTITELSKLEQLPAACFGSRTLTVRAWVAPPCDGCGGTSASAIAPSWFDGLGGSNVALAEGRTGPEIPAFVPPKLGRCPEPDASTCPFRPYVRRFVIVTARFDDPLAQTCRYSAHPPGPGFTRQDAIAECRNELVVMSVAASGDLPPTDSVDFAAPDRAASAMSASLFAIALIAVAVAVVALRGRRQSGARDD
jgi:hypothetical protein